MQLIHIVVLILVISSFDRFSDGMLRTAKYWKYRGQAEIRGKKLWNI